MTTKLDPLLKHENVIVEPEELLEPDLERPKGKPRLFGRLRVRLSNYGNRMVGSGRRFLEIAGETLSNIGTALAGSIILLPVLIVTRSVSVLARGIVEIIKPMMLSIFCAFFDLLRALLWPLHELFVYFNKHLLFPLMKRIREDDAAALAAFVVLLAITGGICCTCIQKSRLSR